jgi:hypothetical protein
VNFFTLSWVGERWNLSSVSLLLSLFLKSIGENLILWFLNINHSGTIFVIPHLGSTNVPFHSTHVKTKYVELIGKEKWYNSRNIYCQAKGWPKKS